MLPVVMARMMTNNNNNNNNNKKKTRARARHHFCYHHSQRNKRNSTSIAARRVPMPPAALEMHAELSLSFEQMMARQITKSRGLQKVRHWAAPPVTLAANPAMLANWRVPATATLPAGLTVAMAWRTTTHVAKPKDHRAVMAIPTWRALPPSSTTTTSRSRARVARMMVRRAILFQSQQTCSKLAARAASVGNFPVAITKAITIRRDKK